MVDLLGCLASPVSAFVDKTALPAAIINIRLRIEKNFVVFIALVFKVLTLFIMAASYNCRLAGIKR
jgi:hypothetical protein